MENTQIKQHILVTLMKVERMIYELEDVDYDHILDETEYLKELTIKISEDK